MRAGHRARIEDIAGNRLAGVTYLPGGSVGEVWHARFEDGAELVAKTADNKGNLETEAMMLRYLAAHSCLPVPAVFHAAPDLLLIEWIDHDTQGGRAFEIEAADQLAALHDISAAAFGFEQPTLIGPLRQPNGWSENWICFFAEKRLLSMGHYALNCGRMPCQMMARLESLCARLSNWLPVPEKPSLVHGDVWRGNILSKNGKLAGFIDPAIYFGVREVELAYTALFATFGENFIDRYQEHYPLDKAFFTCQTPLYQLYPLLVHVALFGGSYVQETDSILRRFVG